MCLWFFLSPNYHLHVRVWYFKSFYFRVIQSGQFDKKSIVFNFKFMVRWMLCTCACVRCCSWMRTQIVLCAILVYFFIWIYDLWALNCYPRSNQKNNNNNKRTGCATSVLDFNENKEQKSRFFLLINLLLFWFFLRLFFMLKKFLGFFPL